MRSYGSVWLNEMLIWFPNFLPPLANSEMYFGVRRNFSDKQTQKTTLYKHNIQTVRTQHLFACWFIATYKKKMKQYIAMPSVYYFIMIFQVCAYSMRALCFEWAFLFVFFFFMRAVNVTCPIVSVRQPEDVIPAFCARRCLTVNGRQRFMKLWRWQIEALVKHPDAGGCRNSSWLTAMPRIGPGLAVYTAVSGLDRGRAGRAPAVTTPGHGSVPLPKKTNLQKRKSASAFFRLSHS